MLKIVETYRTGQLVERGGEVGMVVADQPHVFTVLWAASGQPEYFEQGHSLAGALRDITAKLETLSKALEVA